MDKAKKKTKSSGHHCPKESKGGCRWDGGLKLCSTHQTRCPDHDLVHLTTEECRACAGAEAAQARKEKKEKEKGKGDD